MKLLNIVAIIVGMVAVSPQAQSQTYQSVFIDSTGKLSTALTSGKVVRPPKLQDQVSFSQPFLSSDHRTVGWLANYADPSDPRGSSDSIAGRLVLYRAGRVFRTFGTDQVFWSWQFVNQDRDVAFCIGPTHGGASGCELHRIGSGYLREQWDAHAAGDPPLWVKGLSF